MRGTITHRGYVWSTIIQTLGDKRGRIGSPTASDWSTVQETPESIDWFKGKITGKSHISWENLWFPVVFPLSQPIDRECDFAYPQYTRPLQNLNTWSSWFVAGSQPLAFYNGCGCFLNAQRGPNAVRSLEWLLNRLISIHIIHTQH